MKKIWQFLVIQLWFCASQSNCWIPQIYLLTTLKTKLQPITINIKSTMHLWRNALLWAGVGKPIWSVSPSDWIHKGWSKSKCTEPTLAFQHCFGPSGAIYFAFFWILGCSKCPWKIAPGWQRLNNQNPNRENFFQRHRWFSNSVCRTQIILFYLPL